MPPRQTTRLTERQDHAYEFIRDEIRLRKRPPTIKELCAYLGVKSPNAAWKILNALETKGLITRDRQSPRGIHLVDTDDDPYGANYGLPQLPLISRTSSDEPENLRVSHSRLLTIDPFFLGDANPDACLLCRAGDDGMYPDGFRKGDFLIVEEKPLEEIRNGQVVASLIRTTVLVRYFEFTDDQIHLRASERSYSKRSYVPDDILCHVIGPVVGILRTFQNANRRQRFPPHRR